MPKHGYTKMFQKMIAGVPILLNTDFKFATEHIKYKKLIFTGPIDEFFNYQFGRLPYRSLRFSFHTYKKEFYQKWGQINYPNEMKYTRVVEIKHVTKQVSPFTTISKEYPRAKGEPFYPIPNQANQDIYLKYKKLSEKIDNIYFIGRLAEYKYLNMDQVVKKSLDLFKSSK